MRKILVVGAMLVAMTGVARADVADRAHFTAETERCGVHYDTESGSLALFA